MKTPAAHNLTLDNQVTTNTLAEADRVCISATVELWDLLLLTTLSLHWVCMHLIVHQRNLHERDTDFFRILIFQTCRLCVLSWFSDCCGAVARSLVVPGSIRVCLEEEQIYEPSIQMKWTVAGKGNTISWCLTVLTTWGYSIPVKLESHNVINPICRTAVAMRMFDSTYCRCWSSRDVQGHGDHTASIAAGNFGIQHPLGTSSGVAPRARLAIYKVWQFSTIVVAEFCFETGFSVSALMLATLHAGGSSHSTPSSPDCQSGTRKHCYFQDATYDKSERNVTRGYFHLLRKYSLYLHETK